MWRPSHPGLLGLGSAGAGALLGGLLEAIGDRKIAVYWLWLALAVAGTAMLPVLPVPGKLGGEYWMVYLAYFYFSPSEWQPILLIHSFAALAIGSTATVVHELSKLRRRSAPFGRVFSLLELLIAIGALAALFGMLRWCGAPPLVYFAVLLLVSGRPLSLFVTAGFARFFRLTGGAIQRTDD